MSNAVVKDDSEHNHTRKIMVITFRRDHWEKFKQMHQCAREFVPGLIEDGFASSIIAAAIRSQMEPQPTVETERASIVNRQS